MNRKQKEYEQWVEEGRILKEGRKPMTLEESKELCDLWKVRADTLEERVRQLEAENHALKHGLLPPALVSHAKASVEAAAAMSGFVRDEDAEWDRQGVFCLRNPERPSQRIRIGATPQRQLYMHVTDGKEYMVVVDEGGDMSLEAACHCAIEDGVIQRASPDTAGRIARRLEVGAEGLLKEALKSLWKWGSIISSGGGVYSCGPAVIRPRVEGGRVHFNYLYSERLGDVIGYDQDYALPITPFTGDEELRATIYRIVLRFLESLPYHLIPKEGEETE